jgi:hypothetical protein
VIIAKGATKILHINAKQFRVEAGMWDSIQLVSILVVKKYCGRSGF